MTLKIRPRPHVSGYFVKQEIFFSVLVCRPPANGVLLKTVPRVEILKNAGFSFTCGRTQTDVFEYDDVIHYILLASRWMLSYFHRFSVFMWKGENDSNTLRSDSYFLKTEKKISVLKKYPVTCRQGLSLNCCFKFSYKISFPRPCVLFRIFSK